MQPVVIARDMKPDIKVSERVQIETSINSVRISLNIKQSDEIEELLVRKFVSFLQQRGS